MARNWTRGQGPMGRRQAESAAARAHWKANSAYVSTFDWLVCVSAVVGIGSIMHR